MPGCCQGPEWRIRSSLRLTAVPLAVGVGAALAATVALIAGTTPQWMVGVSDALEDEETASLARLSKAQAAYSDEIMGQMVAEVDAIERFAADVWLAATDATFNGTALDPAYPFSAVAGSAAASSTTTATAAPTALPAGAYMWGWPFSATSNVLYVGTKPSEGGRSPEEHVPENSVCTARYAVECWTEPAGGADELLRDGTRGSPKASSVEWPTDLGLNVSALPTDLVEDLRISSYLEDVFAEVYAANPTAVSIYVGTERTGVMRQYPYAHRGTGVAKTRYAAASTPPFSTSGGAPYWGYDPRKRPWYAEAKYEKKLIVSAPYVYSTPPFPVGITVAKPIMHPVTGALWGVIGLDVTVDLLEKVVVTSSILFNGYAFLVNMEQRPVVYPCSTLGGESQEVCSTIGCAWDGSRSVCTTPDKDAAGNLLTFRDFEFKDQPAEGDAFQQEHWTNGMAALKVGAGTYMKRARCVAGDRASGCSDGGTLHAETSKWHIAYAPVPNAGYSLALVVPDADIQVPAARVRDSIAVAIGVQTGVYIGLTIAGFLVFILLLQRVSKSVVKPIDNLKQVIDLIIRDLARQADKSGAAGNKGPAFRLDVHDLIKPEDEMCKEISLMKGSFEYMVQALRFGSSAFAKNDLNAAQKVYQDALTMYKALNNRKGEGIATFNLGATEHRRWLQGNKENNQAYLSAESFYMQSINIAREQWRELRSSSMQSGNTRDPDSVSVTVGSGAVIEMTAQARDRGGNNVSSGVDLGTVGHDIADRLSGRLYQLAQLYSDRATIDAGKAAEPLLVEALQWDSKTNNVLGYASRVGLLCRILVVLGRYDEAAAKIGEQLEILRDRILREEDLEEKLAEGAAKQVEGKRSRRKSRMDVRSEQEQDELIQALQHALKDAAVVQGCAQGDDHLALRYFVEALSCSPRSAPHVLNGIFKEMGNLFERHRTDGRFPPALIDAVAEEAGKRGAQAALPKDMVFVIDYSGSMAGGKMRRARNGILSLMDDQLTALDRGSVIKFSASVDVLTPQLIFTADPALRREVNSLTAPRGGTALWDGIGAALDQLASQSIGQGREPWVVVVTDGTDNRSKRTNPRQLQQRIQVTETNIIMLSCGVDDQQAHVDMGVVVSNTPKGAIGEKIDIDNSEELDEAFRKIGAIIGDHVQIEHH